MQPHRPTRNLMALGVDAEPILQDRVLTRERVSGKAQN
jgi:hypothetical protein